MTSNVGQLGNGTTSIGMSALKNHVGTAVGRDNTAYGHEALENLGPGKNESTAFGSQALSENVSGENSAFGAYAAARCAGEFNTAVGSWALRNVSGNYNTACGHRSMAGDDNDEKVSIPPVSGSCNTAYGFGTYREKPEGHNNTASGYNSMYLAKGTSVNDNSAYGYMSLANLDGSVSSASSNSAFGKNAGVGITSGNNNTLVGGSTGASLITGSNNTLIGKNSNVIGTGVGASSYRTAIGADSVVEQDNSIVLGRTTLDSVGIGTTMPNAKLHVRAVGGVAVNVDGGFKVKVQTILTLVAGIYTVAMDTYLVIITGSGSAAISLPTIAATNPFDDGRVFSIRNTTTASVVISVSSSPPSVIHIDTAPASTTQTLLANTSVTLISSGGNYYEV